MCEESDEDVFDHLLRWHNDFKLHIYYVYSNCVFLSYMWKMGIKGREGGKVFA